MLPFMRKDKRKRLPVIGRGTSFVLKSRVVSLLKTTLKSELRKCNVSIRSKELQNGSHAVYLRGSGEGKPKIGQAKALVRTAVSMSEKNLHKIPKKSESPKNKEDMSIDIVGGCSNIGEEAAATTSKDTLNLAVDTLEEILLEPPRIEVDIKNLYDSEHPGGTLVLKGQFVRFLKSTLQSDLRDRLNIEIESIAQERGHHKVYLVGTGGNPKFEEALELIRKAISMSERSWCRIQKKLESPKKKEEMSITILDESSNMGENSVPNTLKETLNSTADTPEEILLEPQRIDIDKAKEDKSIVILDENSTTEEHSTTDTSKESSISTADTLGKTLNSTAGTSEEILLESPGTELLCKGSLKDRLCPVVIDTHGGAGPSNPNVGAPLYQRRSRRLKMVSNESSSTETSVNSSSNPNSELKPASTSSIKGSKDFIQISHCSRLARKRRDSADETIVLGDDTIVISSEDESEDDIKIERVVARKSSSPKKVKRKSQKRSLSAGSVPVTPQKSAVLSNKISKRKSKNTPSPLQRSTKVSKRCENTDVSTSILGTAPLALNTYPSSLLGVVPLAVNPYHQTSQSLSDNNLRAGKTKNSIASNSQSKTLSAHNGHGPSTSSGKYSFDNNIIALGGQPTEQKGLRPVVIDARNVASDKGRFNFSKLVICIKYFRDRNHKVIALLPRHVRSVIHGPDRILMDKLEEEQILCFTPSRKIPGGRSYASYDDRYIVQVAHQLGGVIVSNDNYRDIMTENPNWKETIENRLLMFTWVGDMLMFPNDPMGREGPHLEEFLRFPKGGE